MFELIDADACRLAVRGSQKRFYVYVLLKPDGKPFYVGKGLGQRVFAHESEARNTTTRSHKLNVIRSIIRNGGRVGYAIPLFSDDEATTHAFESKLIAQLGRHDLRNGPLTNQTDGGEGVTGLSEETMAKKAANLGGASEDPERRVANEFFHSITGPQSSVSIKPLGARKLQPTVPHPSSRMPTERMARTLVAAALASNQLLEVGGQFPRCLQIERNVYVIENGVAKDMAKAGMITVLQGAKPELEKFVLTAAGLAGIRKFIARDRLEDLGVLEPLI